MTAPTDRELAQAYEQGYRDGRYSLASVLEKQYSMTPAQRLKSRQWQDELSEELLPIIRVWIAQTGLPRPEALRQVAAIIRREEDQPATKGE